MRVNNNSAVPVSLVLIPGELTYLFIFSCGFMCDRSKWSGPILKMKKKKNRKFKELNTEFPVKDFL